LPPAPRPPPLSGRRRDGGSTVLPLERSSRARASLAAQRGSRGRRRSASGPPAVLSARPRCQGGPAQPLILFFFVYFLLLGFLLFFQAYEDPA
jgi:hypothetical protein